MSDSEKSTGSTRSTAEKKDKVFSDMQVKQESSVSDLISASESSPLHHHHHNHHHDHQHCRSSPCCSSDISTLTTTTTQDMQTCQSSITSSLSNISNSHLLQQQQDKSSSGYSLWAEYFDAFPVLTEFDLRSGVNGSTGTSIASSSSASSENWPSPGSGTPFSDCEQDDTAFIDEHAVPTSVIDEIVQTLKMDGYNFDHLGDDIMDSTNTTSYPVKQEQDMSNQQPCYLQSPVYTSLCPPKLQLHPESSAARKYVNMNDNSMHTCNDSNNNINYMNNNMNNLSIFDQVMDGKWCDNTASLPSMTISLQQIQQHTTQLQQPIIVQQHQPGMQQHQNSQQQMSHDQQQPQQQHQIQTYASSPVEDNTMTGAHYTSSTSMFPGSYAPLQPLQQYKFMTTSPMALQPPPLVQTCEKSTETKPRRRRSTNSSARVEKPHLCTECGAAFKLSANLKQHLVIHTGEKPFSCDICKAMFTRLSSLKTHHRLHTGEKPHICPFCNAAFADRSAMKAHKRIHTGERPYKCTVCSTSFTQLSHLNAHKRTHTGEKPYACGICGTTFKQLGHLKRHEKSHVCSRM